MGQVKTTYKRILGEIKQVDTKKREIEFIASRQEVDADGDVVVAKGINTTRYEMNPTMLVDHDRAHRFARVDALWLGSVRGADALLGRATVLPPGVSGEVDQAYAELVHGALNGISIGFIPKEIDPAPILSGQRGATFRQVELLEISLVPLGSCASAVVTAKSFKGAGGATMSREQTRTALEEQYDEMDARHAAVQAASDTWDRCDPRNSAAMGVVILKPDFKSLDADYIPRACRGSAGQTGEEQFQDLRAHLRSRGLVPPSGPARAHRGNLGATPEIEFDASTVQTILRDLAPKIGHMVREAVGKAQPKIDRAVARARGRID